MKHSIIPIKHPIITSLGLAVLAGASLVTPALAGQDITTTTDSFGSGDDAFTMDFVTVGNPNYVNDIHGTGYGAVASPFRMGTYEVSASAMYRATTAGNLGITRDFGRSNIATAISWNEAARFVNWLNTSSGSVAAYKFAVQPGQAGYDVNANILLWSYGEAGYNNNNPFRNSNAKYFLPSENEWYKAAYYSGSGNTYYDYATGSNTAPTAVNEGTDAGTAVYKQPYGEGPTTYNLADYNSAGGLSPYGTMGQGGNAWDWTESTWSGDYKTDEARTVRGGCWVSDAESYISSLHRGNISPDAEYSSSGLRVASLTAVPEVTSSFTLFGLISGGLLLRRRTKHMR
jgi:formylglycine-generating enzyme required for sulfatase activity